MKEKQPHILAATKRLGSAMKRIRKSQNEKTIFVARKLGYDDDSTYCRIERGEIVNISIWTILDFCKLFDCNIVHLFKLADIDIFETHIKSWSQFYQSLSNLTYQEASELLELADKISPPPYKIEAIENNKRYRSLTSCTAFVQVC